MGFSVHRAMLRCNCAELSGARHSREM